MQNLVGGMEAVRAGRKPDLRFVTKLGRPRVHVGLVHIGRVAEDQVVLPTLEIREKVGLHELHSILDPMTLDIDPRHRQCVVGDVDGVNLRVRECARRRNCDAAAPRAEVDRAPHIGLRNPGLKPVLDQFRNRGARHEHTFIHVETKAAEPRLVDEISQRQPLGDASRREVPDSVDLRVVEFTGVDGLGLVVRQAGLCEDEPCGLVPGIVRTVTVTEPGVLETDRDFTDYLLDLHAAAIYHLERPYACRIDAPIQSENTFSMGPRNLLVGIVLALALAAGVFVALRSDAPSAPISAMVLPNPDSLPEFSLLDQQGNTIDRSVFAGQWDLVFFGFTHCPDICPTTLQLLATARAELASQGQEPLPRIVLVSVDPERDTPEIIGQYMDYFGDGNLGITGTLEEISKLTTGLGIYFQKQAADGDNYLVDHSAAVLVIDPDGRFSALFSGPHNVENFVHDLPIIMNEKK